MADLSYDLVIVGMGSGGMVAAEFASTLDIKVAAVERDRVGGDCLWTGCVPSKALLASAKVANAMRHADRYGLTAVEPEIDTARVFERIRSIQADLAATDDTRTASRRRGCTCRQRILPRDEPALVDRLTRAIRESGVELSLGVEIESVSVEGAEKVVRGTTAGGPAEWRAEQILVAAGRRPNVEGLGLEQVGVETGERGVVVNGAMRTSVKSIYAAGDMAGRYLFTHSAGYEAAAAIRNMFFPGSSEATDFVPWCTYTDPELAHAGLTEAQAREEHGEDDVHVWRHDLSHSDRARAESNAEGEIRIVTAKGRMVGAHVLSAGAGEVIHELALAIHEKTKLSDLGSLVHVYPTLSMGIGQLAGEASYERAGRLGFLVRSKA